jgi:hypothetical protein
MMPVLFNNFLAIAVALHRRMQVWQGADWHFLRQQVKGVTATKKQKLPSRH